MPTRANWQFTTEPVPDAAQLADGEVLVKTLALSLDPAMRGWMNEGKSYIPPVAIGEVMRAGGIGVVVASKQPGFKRRRPASARGLGVQEYARIGAAEAKRAGLFKIDPRLGTPTQWLNVLGMPGMTGYFGLIDVGQPKAGETVVVSGAAGAVGQTVGQLAKIKGCRVVGIAGGPAKCDWVVRELGFDACIDYKAGAVQGRPEGSTARRASTSTSTTSAARSSTPCSRASTRKARIVICGAISQYNNTTPVKGPRTTCRCSSTARAWKAWSCSTTPTAIPAAIAELAGYLKDGRMKSREDVVAGPRRLSRKRC